METKIYIKELPCYQKKGNASEKKLRVMERHFYNLGLLATEGQQKEMEAFIRSRGKELSLATLDADIIHYKVVVRFMKEKYPLLNSFRVVPEEVLVKKFKAWLLATEGQQKEMECIYTEPRKRIEFGYRGCGYYPLQGGCQVYEREVSAAK